MAISLLPHDRLKVENKNLRRLLNIGAGFLAGYIVVMMVVGGMFIYLNFQNQNLAKTREVLATEVKNNQDKEEKLVLLKDRLSTLSNIPGVLNFQRVLDILPELLGANLTVNGINLTGDQLKLLVLADDTFELEELINNINKNSNLTKATMENLDLDATGQFLATLSLEVKTK